MSYFSEEIQSILKRLNKLERENRELKNENKQMNKNIINNEQKCNMLQERINILTDVVEELNTENEQMKEKISKLENDNNDISNQVRLMKRNYSNKFNLLTKNIMRNEKIISKINKSINDFMLYTKNIIHFKTITQGELKIKYHNDLDVKTLLYYDSNYNTLLTQNFSNIITTRSKVSVNLIEKCINIMKKDYGDRFNKLYNINNMIVAIQGQINHPQCSPEYRQILNERIKFLEKISN
jgi:hypothetical protein